MLDKIPGTVAALLNSAGIPAAPAYPARGTVRGGSGVFVSLLRGETPDGRQMRYLGMTSDPETGDREVYGLRCRVTLGLDVYAPLTAADPAGDCLALCDRAVAALEMLQLHSLRCGAPEPDRAAGTARLHAEAEASALLLARSPAGDEPEFTDFVLRGELNL